MIFDNRYTPIRWEHQADYTWEPLIEAMRKINTSALSSCQATTIKVENYFNPAFIKNVEFYPPAVKMTFSDGTVTTAVAQEGDEYNPEVGMMVCIMKYIWKGNSFNTEFRKWIKADAKKKADKEAEKAKVAKEKADKAKKIAKAQERRRRYEEKQIEMQKEAYLRAMKEANARASE